MVQCTCAENIAKKEAGCWRLRSARRFAAMALLVGALSLVPAEGFSQKKSELLPKLDRTEKLDANKVQIQLPVYETKEYVGAVLGCSNSKTAIGAARSAENDYKDTSSWLQDAIGYVASALIAVAGFPQFLRTLKTKSTKDISLETFGAFTLGEALFTIYGLMIESWPITSSAFIALVMMGSTFFMKLSGILGERKQI